MKRSSLMDAWLNEVAKSEYTQKNYIRQIKIFLEQSNTTLEDIAEEWDRIETYRQEKIFCKKWKKKLKLYKNSLMNDSNLAEGTIEAYMIPLNSFFRWYEIPVHLGCNTINVTYHNRDILREEIDSIIVNTSHIRDKAYFSFLKDSGLRPVVLERLQYIDMKEDWIAERLPCKVNVPKEKNKGKYKRHYTFIGHETVDYLRKYFDTRFGKDNKPKDNDLVFSQSNTENIPISTSSENNIFTRVALKLEIAQKRDKGKPKAITQYSLRKFFRNNITNSPDIDSVDCHFFMGHKLGMMDEHYFSAQNVTKFREKYEKAYKYLIVKSVPNNYKEEVRYLKSKLEQTEIALEQYKRRYGQLTNFILESEDFNELKSRIVTERILPDEPKEKPKKEEE